MRVSVPDVVASQVPVAPPPAVFNRWTKVTSLNAPVPVFDDACRRSHGTAPVIAAVAWPIFVPLTTLPSMVEVQFGPCPCVPTCAKAESKSTASGCLSTHI